MTASDEFDSYALWTADGRHLIVSSNEIDAPNARLYLRAADGTGTPEPLTENAPGEAQAPNCITPDGRELFYVDPRQHLMSVRVQTDQPTFVSESAVDLFDASSYAMAVGSRPGRTYEIDGDMFLLLKEVEASPDAAGRGQVVVQNWFEELKRLVPTK